MENQRLYELAVKLSERSAMSLEECVWRIQNLVRVIENVRDAIKQIEGEVIRVWNEIKESIKLCEENEAIHGWYIDWDTRKKSQVMNNRPSFAVRKIISVR